MADISTRMSVSGLSEYKSAMQQAAQSVKTLDAQLKKADAEFKATGDKEKYMADKAKILEDRLKAQKSAAKNAEQAMKLLKQNGDTTSTTYQKLAQQLAEAETGILETSAAMNQLGQSEQEAAQGADQLTASVNGIGKKISLQQVIGGINKITDGLESAAKKAVELGKAIWTEITEQAQKADDIATKATMYDMTPEQYQAIAKVAATWGDVSVEAIMKARQRVQGKISDIADDLMGIGVNPTYTIPGKDENIKVWRDWQDIFWEAGDALLNLSDQYEKSEKAQAIFGRKWEELMPMFKMGRELYEKTVASQIVADNESIQKLAELNDTIATLQSDFESLEQEFLAGMAPSLTEASKVLDSLLGQLMEYLKKPEGQKMLEELNTAVSGLFEDLAKIDPEDVVNNFVSLFSKLVSSFTWIKNNWSAVKSGLNAIVGVWAVGKVTSGAATILSMLNGLQGLRGAAAAEAGAAAGTSWGVAFAEAVAAAAPWLVGAYALLKPADTADDSLFNNKTGELTQEGWRQFQDYAAGRVKDANWDDILQLVGDRYGGLSDILSNTAAINAMARALYGDHEFIGVNPMAQPELYRTRINNELFDTLEGMGYEPRIEIEAKPDIEETLQKGTIELTVGDPTGRIKTPNGWKEPEIEVKPVPEEGAAEEISAEIGVVPIAAKLIPTGGSTRGVLMGSGGGGVMLTYDDSSFAGLLKGGFANGLPFVPFDGYPAILHRGEQVVPAREVSNRSYSSNLYIENMNMNNGQDAEGLAARIAAANKRTMSGFGS